MAVEKYGAACEVVYCDTMATEHPDNDRFFADVERWIGVTITRIRSEKYQTIGARLVRVKNVRVFLDELPADEYAPDDNIDCGPACQLPLPWGDAA